MVGGAGMAGVGSADAVGPVGSGTVAAAAPERASIAAAVASNPAVIFRAIGLFKGVPSGNGGDAVRASEPLDSHDDAAKEEQHDGGQQG